jgi:hypothetical protein
VDGVSETTDTDSDDALPDVVLDFFFAAGNNGGATNSINTSAHIIEFSYITDGSLTAAEVLDFHNLVQDFVLTPLAR